MPEKVLGSPQKVKIKTRSGRAAKGEISLRQSPSFPGPGHHPTSSPNNLAVDLIRVLLGVLLVSVARRGSRGVVAQWWSIHHTPPRPTQNWVTSFQGGKKQAADAQPPVTRSMFDTCPSLSPNFK